MNLKFISYDGEYPCLCSGTLTIEFNDRQYQIHNCLRSGGEVDLDTGDITKGKWSINVKHLHKELQQYHKEITKLVNQHVPYGCCGGCD